MINELLLRVEYEGSIYDLVVDNEVPLRIDMSAVESQDLGKFFGIGSQTFNLPGTKNTNRFFNYAYDVSTDNVPGFYNTLECSVVLNGETVLIGSLQLVEVVTNDEGYVTYKVQVVDKVLQFEQTLANKLVTNADWSAYDHTFSSSSILDSWDDNLLGGAVYYPLSHYGYPEGTQGGLPNIALTIPDSNLGSFINNVFTPMQTQQFLPAIRLKDTLDVIFDQVGFTYTGSFTETADFNNLYILNKPNEGLGIVASGSDQPTFTGTMSGQGSTSYQMQTSPNNWERVSYQSETSDPTNSYTPICADGPGDPVGSKFTAPATGEYTFAVNVSAFNPLWNSPTITGVCEITLMKGTLPCGSSGGSGTTITTNSITLDSNYGFNTFEVAINASDTITQGEDVWVWIEWYATAGTPTSPANDLILGNFVNTFQCTSGPVSYEGATVDMSQQWQPDTKSLDIIRGLLQQFNLVMIPEVGNKSVIRIEQFDDWIRQGEIKDWTSKYDTAKRISVSHTVDELEREVILQSAEDADRISKTTKESAPNYQYGTLRLLADNNISQGEKTIGDYFGPVVLGGQVGYNPGDISQPTTDFDFNTNFVYPHLYKLENDKLTSFAFKPRLGYKVNNNFPTNQYMYLGVYGNSDLITGSYSTIANVSELPVVSGSSNDLHFNNTYSLLTYAPLNLQDGVNNFNNYWKTYLDSLYWEGSKKIVLDLFFEPYEYKSINLNDRILIKGQAYRINKISGFNVSTRDVVTVELIKLYPQYWQVEGAAIPTSTPTPTPTDTPTPTPTETPIPWDPCVCVETGSCTAHTVYPGGGDFGQACDQTSTPRTLYTDNAVWEDSVFVFTNCATKTYLSEGSEPHAKNGYNLQPFFGSCSPLMYGILCEPSASFTYAAAIEDICASVTSSTLYASSSYTLRADSSYPVYSDSGLTTPATDGYYKYGAMILRVVSGSTVALQPLTALYSTQTSNMGYCEYPCLFSSGITPTPTPTPGGPTPTPTPTVPPVNFRTTATYAVPNYQYVRYATYLFLDGMGGARTHLNGPSISCGTGCTEVSSNVWNSNASGSIAVQRLNPSGIAADSGDISISFTVGSGNITNESNPKVFNSGDTVIYEWDLDSVTSDAQIQVDITEG